MGGHQDDGRALCSLCYTRSANQRGRESLSIPTVLRALVGGIFGALIGAAAWVEADNFADFEIGYFAAVLLGFFVGKGVVLAAGSARGFIFQIIAIDCAVLGLLLAKYALFAVTTKSTLAQNSGTFLNYLDAQTVSYFFQSFTHRFSSLDAIWAVLAVGVAFAIPRSRT